jgi:hypothetical protein
MSADEQLHHFRRLDYSRDLDRDLELLRDAWRRFAGAHT